jgi:CHC2 zinc finger
LRVAEGKGAVIPAHQIERARDTRVEDVLERHGVRLKRSGSELVGPCPRCAGVDRFAADVKKQIFNCRHCGAKGNVIALEQFLSGCGFAEAVQRLAGGAWGPSRAAGPIPTAARVDDRSDGVAKARQRWNEAVNPRGTIVETYLAGRGLDLAEAGDDVIRYHPRCPWKDDDGALTYAPVMLAAMRDIRTDELVAVSRRRLTPPQGEKVGKPKFLGAAAGAAIKLDADENVTNGLHICEGVETGIAGRILGLKPMWTLGSKGAIETFPVLGGIGCLTILAEPDAEAAVEKCARRWYEAGREVVVNRSNIGKDLADAVASLRP